LIEPTEVVELMETANRSGGARISRIRHGSNWASWIVVTVAVAVSPAVTSCELFEEDAGPNGDEEAKLYSLLMNHRQEKGLPSIPLSSSLTHVAQTHARDLVDNYQFGDNSCNMHSWSDKGKWTPCCYTADHAQAACMWNKPGELTSYQGNGYEISYGGSKGYHATADLAFRAWKGSSGHYSTIVNEGIWKDVTWNAIGIGINKEYAVVWFGKEVDK